MHAPRSVPTIILGAILVMGAIGVVLAMTESTVFDLDRFTVPKELVLHLTGLAGLSLLLPRWRRVEAGVVEALLAAALAWTVASALMATNYWLAARSAGVAWSALIVFVMARAVSRAGLRRFVLVGMAAAATVGALTGLAQTYGFDAGLLAGERAPGGTFGNRNFLAHLQAIAFPAVVLLGIASRGRGRRLLAMAAAAVMVAAVVLTRSRAAWLGLGLSTAAMGVLTITAGRRWLEAVGNRRVIELGGAALLGLALALALPNRLAWRSASPYSDSLRDLVNYQEGSGAGRLVQYRNSLRLVPIDPVFGVGPGNWQVHYPRVTTAGDPSFSAADPIPTNPWPSSDWIGILTERGPIGALLLLLAGASALLVASRRVSSEDPDQAGEAVALAGILVAAMVTGLFDAVLLNAAPAFFLAALTGLLLPETGVTIARPLAGRRRGLWLAGLLSGSLVLALLSAGQLQAVRLTREDRQTSTLERALRYDRGNHRLHLLLATRGPCDDRLPHARAAARLLPFHPSPRQALRACGESIP